MNVVSKLWVIETFSDVKGVALRCLKLDQSKTDQQPRLTTLMKT
jgi:hypothetical protein